MFRLLAKTDSVREDRSETKIHPTSAEALVPLSLAVNERERVIYFSRNERFPAVAERFLCPACAVFSSLCFYWFYWNLSVIDALKGGDPLNEKGASSYASDDDCCGGDDDDDDVWKTTMTSCDDGAMSAFVLLLLSLRVAAFRYPPLISHFYRSFFFFAIVLSDEK